ncbi:putative attractin [Trichonephila clavipes]|nr:putative attractin [Trichonephila clavipes]
MAAKSESEAFLSSYILSYPNLANKSSVFLHNREASGVHSSGFTQDFPEIEKILTELVTSGLVLSGLVLFEISFDEEDLIESITVNENNEVNNHAVEAKVQLLNTNLICEGFKYAPSSCEKNANSGACEKAAPGIKCVWNFEKKMCQPFSITSKVASYHTCSRRGAPGGAWMGSCIAERGALPRPLLVAESGASPAKLVL